MGLRAPADSLLITGGHVGQIWLGGSFRILFTDILVLC